LAPVRADLYCQNLKHDVCFARGLVVAGTAPENIFDSNVKSVLPRLRFGIAEINDSMDTPVPDHSSNPGDGPWQSIRLAFGALLLILGGLGLMLLDGNNHTSTARSTVSRTQVTASVP
jgi:hypothetical protein